MAPPDLQVPGPVPLTTTGAGAIRPLEATPAALTFLGRRITPLTRRRLDNFRANRRGFWSLWIFLVVFGVTLVA
jgi:microcin C transport system permease protein